LNKVVIGNKKAGYSEELWFTTSGKIID